jgi:LacI family transcriptional regulator
MPSHEWSRWRRESFTAVLKRQTISCECIDLSSLTAASLGSEKDRRSLERWLMMLPKPVGILACNDHCGRILLELCDNLRLRVPDQVGVMGVDNDDLDCELSRPPMTSIEPNHERIGYAAAETLEQMLEGQNTDSPKLIRPKMLVARGSTDATAIREPLMAEALRFIRAYACKGVSIIDVSLHVGVSRRSLEAQFRQFVGRSVHTEIQRVRLEAAQRLLGETDWKLDLVAERSGFKTAAHLSALFYDKLQLRPGEYRKRIQSRSQSS